jgi:hypothetical protein
VWAGRDALPRSNLLLESFKLHILTPFSRGG